MVWSISFSHDWRSGQQSSLPSISRVVARARCCVGWPVGSFYGTSCSEASPEDLWRSTSRGLFSASFLATPSCHTDWSPTSTSSKQGRWVNSLYQQRIWQCWMQICILQPLWQLGHEGTSVGCGRQRSKVLRELHRRWQGVTLHLRRFQSSAIQAVTHKRDIGLTGLLMVLISWPDATYPHGLIVGLPAVGYAPCYHVFPELQVDRISFEDVLGDWQTHNIIGSWRAYARVPMMMWHWHSRQLTPTKASALIPWLELSCSTRFRVGLTVLSPRCVITQSSGKKRIIDDAAVGGQSATSRDANKLVLCTPLRPAQHIQATLSYMAIPALTAAQLSDQFETGGEDWPDAYRHSPMSRSESLLCVVTFWHPDWQQPAFQLYSGLLFGLPLAVTSFNRYSRLVEALGRRL